MALWTPKLRADIETWFCPAQSGIPTADQTLFYSGRPLTGPTATLTSFGINEDDMLLVQRKRPTAGPSEVAGR